MFEKIISNMENDGRKQTQPNIIESINCKETEINPFEHELKLNWKRQIQIAFMTVIVLPFRLIMIGITLFLSWFFALLITLNMSDSKPVGSIRTKIINVWLKLFRSMFFFAGFHHIEVEGRRAKSEEAPILIIGPHSSMMDLFVFCVTSPLPTLVSAMKNARVTAFGSMSKISQPIFIQRNDPESKVKAAREMVRRANGEDTWPQMAIFPEATCTNRKALISFKHGAFAPGAPVQPVLLSYKNDFDTFSWTVGSPGTYKLLWLSLCQFSIKAKITYLPVYYPSEIEKQDAFLYARNVRNIMSEKGNLPCTEHSYEDCRLMWTAMSLGLPWRTGIVEYVKIKQALGLNYEAIVEKLIEFSKISTDRKDGKVLISDITKYYKVSVTPTLQKLFQKNHSASDNSVSFRQYIIALTSLSNILIKNK